GDPVTGGRVHPFQEVVETNDPRNLSLKTGQAALRPGLRRERIVVVHAEDGDVGASRRLELCEDDRQVRQKRPDPARAEEIVRADVDGHERNRPSVLLQECDRFGELCASIRVLVLVEGRRTTAGGDVGVLTPVEHRHARLAAAAELDKLKLRVLVTLELEELVGVALVVAGGYDSATPGSPDRLVSLCQRVSEREVVGGLGCRGGTSARNGECDQRGQREENDRALHRSTSCGCGSHSTSKKASSSRKSRNDSRRPESTCSTIPGRPSQP